jgi:transcriptional regulator with XRE-family HTH domain
MTIGQCIRATRERKGKSRWFVTKKSGICSSLLYNWETDKSLPRIDLLICVADVLDVSLDELVGRTNIKSH